MKIYTTITILFISLIQFSCTNTNSQKQEEIQEEEAKSLNIKFTKQQVELAGIKTGTFYEETMHHHIECTGKVTLRPQNKATVSVPVNGFVEQINTTLGAWVDKGFIAMTLRHSDYIDMQTDYLKTSSEFEFAEKEYQRQQILRKEDAISEKAFQKTKANYEVLRAQKAGLAAKLKMIGISAQKITAENIVNTIEVKVPISGYVDEINVDLGEMVTPDKYLMKVINNRENSVTLDVFAQYKNMLELEQEVEYSISGVENNTFKARIVSIGQSIDPHKKTLQVLAQPLNDNNFFAQGTFVDALIFTPGKISKVLPKQAVISRDGKNYIYIQRSAGEYEKVEVEILQVHDGHVKIKEVDSLKSEDIVLKGVNYLVAEDV